jgi:hypothetical protein
LTDRKQTLRLSHPGADTAPYWLACGVVKQDTSDKSHQQEVLLGYKNPGMLYEAVTLQAFTDTSKNRKPKRATQHLRNFMIWVYCRKSCEDEVYTFTAGKTSLLDSKGLRNRT